MGAPHATDLIEVSPRWRSGYDAATNISVLRITAEELSGTSSGEVSTDMNTPMTMRRSHNATKAALLATAITGLAAFSAWVLASVVHLPEPVVVLTVMLGSFAASWVATNHRSTHHRVTLVPMHARSR